MVDSQINNSVLITGGSGYLGSRIGEYLSNLGYQVYLGSRKDIPYEIPSGCKNIITDWQDPDLEFCTDFDLIIHSAGMNAKDCADDPTSALEFNGRCTERLIKKAIKSKSKKFYYLSTAHVYNSPLIGHFDESSSVQNQHPYATSHFYGEKALIKELENKNIKGAVLRLSNCFGRPATNAKECWNLVLNQFIRDAVYEGKIHITGNALSKRDFLPIMELNTVIKKIIDFPSITPYIINISTGRTLSLEDISLLVQKIIFQELGKSIEISSNYKEEEGLLSISNTSLDSMGIEVNNDLNEEIRFFIRFLKNTISNN